MFILLSSTLFAESDIANLFGSGGKPDQAKVLQLRKELKECVEQVRAKMPSFNKFQAEDEAKSALGLRFPPEPPKEDGELVKEVTKKVEIEMAKSFPATLREKISDEAGLKYQVYRVGEKVTVPMRRGRGFDNYTGVYRGWKEGKILIGDRTVLRVDIPEEKIHLFDVKLNNSLKTEYIRRNFDELKEDERKLVYAKMLSDARKENEIAKKFQSLVAEKEKSHAIEQNKSAVIEAVEEFLLRKNEEFERQSSVFGRLAAYTALVVNLPEAMEGMGVELGASNRPVVNLILKESERFSVIQNKTIPELKELRKKKIIMLSMAIGIPMIVLLFIIVVVARRKASA